VIGIVPLRDEMRCTPPALGRILPYGEGVLVGPFACGSSEAGVRCANRDTGHGFQLAREQVKLF
jgi:hypothetical protein